MATAKKKKKKKKPLTPVDRLKIETAKELGLWPKVKAVGWAGLSAAETGQVGGYMTRKLKAENLKNLAEYQAVHSGRKNTGRPGNTKKPGER